MIRIMCLAPFLGLDWNKDLIFEPDWCQVTVRERERRSAAPKHRDLSFDLSIVLSTQGHCPHWAINYNTEHTLISSIGCVFNRWYVNRKSILSNISAINNTPIPKCTACMFKLLWGSTGVQTLSAEHQQSPGVLPETSGIFQKWSNQSWHQAAALSLLSGVTNLTEVESNIFMNKQRPC